MTGMQLFSENIMQRPIYNVNAGKDHLYPLESVNKFLDYMEQKGVNVKRKVYLDRKHGFDFRFEEFGNLCEIIRTWKRPSHQTIFWRFVPGYPNLPVNITEWQYNGKEENQKRKSRF